MTDLGLNFVSDKRGDSAKAYEKARAGAYFRT